MFFLVSGAAASGKSTVARNLSSRLDNIDCHDHDERQAIDEYSRCQQLEEWIQLALARQLQGQDFLLASHSPLGELLACPSTPNLIGISACLLDCNDWIRISRIRNRGIDPRWPPTQHTLNWAAWHRMHAWDPQWEQHVIVENGPPVHSYIRWTGWKQGDDRWQVTIIDTTEAGIDKMLDLCAAWVKYERQKISSLTPATNWWK